MTYADGQINYETIVGQEVGHTRSESVESNVKPIVVPITQDVLFAASDLLRGAHDNKQEPRVAFSHLIGMPLCRSELIDVATLSSADRHCGRKTSRVSQMDTRGEVWVDETTRVTGNAGIWTGICRGAVGPVGCVFDI